MDLLQYLPNSCLSGATEFWVNDQQGLPLMVFTKVDVYKNFIIIPNMIMLEDLNNRNNNSHGTEVIISLPLPLYKIIAS